MLDLEPGWVTDDAEAVVACFLDRGVCSFWSAEAVAEKKMEGTEVATDETGKGVPSDDECLAAFSGEPGYCGLLHGDRLACGYPCLCADMSG